MTIKNTCIYCSAPFGSIVLYKGKIHVLHSEIEHFQPAKDRVGDDCQKVLSCQICNHIKFDHIFETGTDAQNYILDKLLKSDWRLLDSIFNMPVEEEEKLVEEEEKPKVTKYQSLLLRLKK